MVFSAKKERIFWWWIVHRSGFSYRKNQISKIRQKSKNGPNETKFGRSLSVISLYNIKSFAILGNDFLPLAKNKGLNLYPFFSRKFEKSSRIISGLMIFVNWWKLRPIFSVIISDSSKYKVVSPHQAVNTYTLLAGIILHSDVKW